MGAQASRFYNTGTHPEKSFPSGTHPAQPYSAGTGPAKAHPAGMHSAGTYSAGSYGAGTCPPETLSARSDAAATHFTRSYPSSPYDLSSPTRSYASGVNPTRTYPDGTYPAETQFARSYPAEAQLARSYPAETHSAQTLSDQSFPVGTVITPTLQTPVGGTGPAVAVPLGTVSGGTGSAVTGKVWKQRPWSDAAKAAVRRQMGHFISVMEVPGKQDCEMCLHNEPALQDRTWRDIKNYVYNTVNSIKRKKGLIRRDPRKRTKKGVAKKLTETKEADGAMEGVSGTMAIPGQRQGERLAAGPIAVKTPRKQKMWSDEARAAVRRQLGDFTKLMKIPGKRECDACIAAEPALQSRTWKDVKNYVRNTLMTMCRRHISGKQNMDHEKPSIRTPKPAVPQNPEVHLKPGVPQGLPEDPPVYLYL